MSLALISPLPSANLAQRVPIDIISYERTAGAFHSAGALIHHIYHNRSQFTCSAANGERLRIHHEMISNPDRAHEIWREVLRYSTQLQSMNVEFRKLYEALRPELDRFLGVRSDQEQQRL